MKMFKRIVLSSGISLASVAPAFAHLNPEDHGSFMAGFSEGIDWRMPQKTWRPTATR